MAFLSKTSNSNVLHVAATTKFVIGLKWQSHNIMKHNCHHNNYYVNQWAENKLNILVNAATCSIPAIRLVNTLPWFEKYNDGVGCFCFCSISCLSAVTTTNYKLVPITFPLDYWICNFRKYAVAYIILITSLCNTAISLSNTVSNTGQ